jgi:hypothetical protein
MGVFKICALPHRQIAMAPPIIRVGIINNFKGVSIKQLCGVGKTTQEIITPPKMVSIVSGIMAVFE